MRVKPVNHNFTTREKVLILILAVLVVGLCYYWFVDMPVRTGIEQAEAKKESLQTELDGVNLKLAELQRMQSELDSLNQSGRSGYMGSYNSGKAELGELNSVLMSSDEYAIAFSDVTREKNQIRRAFSIQFTTVGYDAAKQTIIDLEKCSYRCMVNDINCSPEGTTDKDEVDLKTWKGKITVSATATFFETMVGGTEDDGLPEDTSEDAEESTGAVDSDGIIY